MKKIRFGKINKVIIFGGNEVTLEMCKFLNKKKINNIVFTTRKQSIEEIPSNKMSFSQNLKINKINFKIVKNLNNNLLKKYINKNTLGLSNACRWIFKEKQIKLFKGKLLNIHFSNLPNNRGAGGLSWNIMMNNFNSGSTIHLINNKIDYGYSLINKSFKFPKKIRASLYDMQNYSYNFQKKIIFQFLKKIFKNEAFNLNKINQTKANSCYWPKLDTKKNGWINWNWPANDIVNFVNAFSNPYSGAKTLLDKKIIKLRKAKVANSSFTFHPFQYGLIYKSISSKVYVACKNGGIILNKKDFTPFNKIIGKRLKTSLTILNRAF